MPYTEENMLKTKERLQDLRKERKWSYEMLERKLSERGAPIDRNVLRKYGLIDTPARLVSQYHVRNAVEEISKVFKNVVENMVVRVMRPKSGQKR